MPLVVPAWSCTVDYDDKVTAAVTGVVLDDNDNEDDDEDFVAVHTFAAMDNLSMKIISFPDMKKMETNLCCKICYKRTTQG